LRHKV